MIQIYKEIINYKKQHPDASNMDIAKALNCSKDQVFRALKSKVKEDDGATIEFTENNCFINTISTKIKTVDDALEYAKVDLTIWEVDRYIINHWDMTNREGKTYTNYQIKVYLKRKVKKNIADALSIIKLDPAPKIKPKNITGECVAFIGLYDTHLGKLGWKEETGENTDLKITKMFYLNAIVDTIQRLKSFGISKIIYPVGQDFMHINNANNTTANDTQLDVDGRLTKVYATAFEVVLLGIQECLNLSPVEVIYLSGNHDRETSWYLAHAIQQRFHDNKNVSVDLNPITRKYRSFGSCLIGMAHAENKRMRSKLHNLMAVEQRDNWSKAHYSEWLTGHLHKRNEERITTVDTDLDQTIRILPSLSGRDKWHFDNAFLSQRACETYIYHPDDGYIGHISTNPRR